MDKQDLQQTCGYIVNQEFFIDMEVASKGSSLRTSKNSGIMHTAWSLNNRPQSNNIKHIRTACTFNEKHDFRHTSQTGTIQLKNPKIHKHFHVIQVGIAKEISKMKSRVPCMTKCEPKDLISVHI